jgi:hypothetical protein
VDFASARSAFLDRVFAEDAEIGRMPACFTLQSPPSIGAAFLLQFVARAAADKSRHDIA